MCSYKGVTGSLTRRVYRSDKVTYSFLSRRQSIPIYFAYDHQFTNCKYIIFLLFHLGGLSETDVSISFRAGFSRAIHSNLVLLQPAHSLLNRSHPDQTLTRTVLYSTGTVLVNV